MAKHGTNHKVATVPNVAVKASQQLMMTTEFAPQEYPVALIYWADACGGDAGWLTLDEVEDDGEVLVQSVGFLVPVGDAGSKEKHMTLLQSIHDGEGINLFYIPVAMVRKIVLLNA